MSEKPSYEELEEKIRELEEERIAFSRKIGPQPGNKSSFSQLFQWAPIPMAYATEKDGYSGSIWNAAWYKTFGYPESLAHGRSGKEIGLWFRSEDRTRLIEMANRQNYVTDFETVLKCYNGDLRQCSLFGRFINNPGNRLLMVVYHDITEQKKAEEERKKLQEQLNQAQKMESMGRLAGGMAHEINNPLAGILQNASVLENRLTDHRMTANVNAAQSVGTTINTIAAFMDQREIPRLIRNIKDPGTRVASIVENMLSFARKSDASFSTHDPAVLMDKVLVLAETDYDLKNHNDFKSIALEKRYEAHLPPVVCESGKIQQVILNILNNGAYAMFESEKDVAPKFVLRLNRETASNMLRIEIEDNGPGMDENTAKQIFDPFFIAKPVGAGTGLGLSVSYFIITETHNGSMDVVSEPGRGATFIIRLPLDPA